MAKSTRQQILFFLLINIRFGLLAGIRWSVCISKSQRILWVSFSRMHSDLCIYHSYMQFPQFVAGNLCTFAFFCHFCFLVFAVFLSGLILSMPHTPCKFFTPVLAGGLLLEFEWQEVSWGLQDSSQYSSRF